MQRVPGIERIGNTFLIFIFHIHFDRSQKQYCPAFVRAPPQLDAVTNSEHFVNETQVPQSALHP